MPIVQGREGEAFTYGALVRSAYALGGKIADLSARGENVGIMLPTTPAGVVAVFALYAFGRVPAFINYLAGTQRIGEACRIADLSIVLTSRRFIDIAKLHATVASLKIVVTVIYLEDLKRSLTFFDKLRALVRSIQPAISSKQKNSDAPAAILFTSGTTGSPKGVVLSHRNILANIAQCRAHVPFRRDWVFFNVLPIFHAFGLTGGTFLPILGGMKTVLYPSPLDREKIPEEIKRSAATVLVATDTFAKLYARSADKSALQGLHYVVLGGEAVNDATVISFAEKSGAVILEGYGATECAPVIALNRPSRNRRGTVGEILPGMEARLETAPGIEIGKRLFVRGPNVMLGYRKDDGSGQSIRSPGDWFDTGDLADIDEDGFLIIKGRLKRFARVGAEMVSLAAVEQHAKSCWPDANHAALAISQADGREAIVLVTDQGGANRAAFAAWSRPQGISRFEKPHYIVAVGRLPLLATGKPDLANIRRTVEQRLQRLAPRMLDARIDRGLATEPDIKISTHLPAAGRRD